MAPIRRPRVVNGPLVKPREPGRLGDLARTLLLGLLLVVPAFLYASLQATLHEYRLEVVQLDGRMDELEAERQQLDLDLAEASNPQRIAALALQVGGLEEASQEHVIYLPRTPVAPARDLSFLAEAIGDADGRQRP